MSAWQSSSAGSTLSDGFHPLNLSLCHPRSQDVSLGLKEMQLQCKDRELTQSGIIQFAGGVLTKRHPTAAPLFYEGLQLIKPIDRGTGALSVSSHRPQGRSGCHPGVSGIGNSFGFGPPQNGGVFLLFC